jgi:membrane protein implicated in regulation of membrane protease activity
MLLKLSETGTRKLSSCVGKLGTVYMNIPARGRGKIRVLVSGAMSTVPARSHTDEPIQAGTDVRVLQVLDNMTVEVESADGEHERE